MAPSNAETQDSCQAHDRQLAAKLLNNQNSECLLGTHEKVVAKHQCQKEEARAKGKKAQENGSNVEPVNSESQGEEASIPVQKGKHSSLLFEI